MRNQEESGGAAFGWVLSGRPKPGSSAELQVFGRGRDKEEERASETESVSEHGLGVVWCGAVRCVLYCVALCCAVRWSKSQEGDTPLAPLCPAYALTG